MHESDDNFPEYHFCKVCMNIQPYRTKHCYECGKCIPKYDHHCVWIGGCVGELNHRLYWAFLLFQSAVNAQTFWVVRTYIHTYRHT